MAFLLDFFLSNVTKIIFFKESLMVLKLWIYCGYES